VISRARAGVKLAPVVTLPDFDDNRRIIVDCFRAIDGRSTKKVLVPLAAAHSELRRVKNSPRHARLAEFLHHTIAALESDQPEGAKYILLTALATFGWPSDLPEAR
jgi:hypothetical protein